MATEKETQGKSARKPRNMERSRFNAISHGLLAAGVTELDNADFYFALLKQLRQELEPVGEIESYLVERIALAMVRVKRASRFEAEAITAALHPERRSKSRLDEQMEHQLAEMGSDTQVVEPGFDPQLRYETVACLADGLGRYEVMHEKRLFRTVQELERRQIARRTIRNAIPSSVTQTTPPAIGSSD